MSTPFDAGLQPERTLLAWRRTCLAFGLVSMIMVRFTAEAFGLLAVLLGLAGAGLAAGAYFSTSIGYRRVHSSLHSSGRTGGDGTPFFLAFLAALAIGAAAGIYLLAAVLERL